MLIPSHFKQTQSHSVYCGAANISLSQTNNTSVPELEVSPEYQPVQDVLDDMFNDHLVLIMVKQLNNYKNYKVYEPIKKKL